MNDFGFIYIVKGAGLFKIGIAASPKFRLHALQVGSPVELELVFEKSSNWSKSVEDMLHRVYSSKRHHGEWYQLSDWDLNCIRNMKYEFSDSFDLQHEELDLLKRLHEDGKELENKQ